MTTQKITVILDSAAIDGKLFDRGSARIFPSMRLPDPDDQLLLEQASARARFTGGTPPTLDLYPSDLIGPQQDDGTPGWTYSVYYDGCPGNPQSWSFYLLSTNGMSQRLSDLAEVPAAQPGSLTADKTFSQDFTPASTVTVTHNLGKKPAVTVIDSAGDEVEGEVNFTSLNALVLSFSAPFGGTVTCN